MILAFDRPGQNQKECKDFAHFIPKEAQVFQKLDFNIINLTAVSRAEPAHRPAWVPDWGTELFESMSFHNLTFQECNFSWLNLSKTHFEGVRFVKCHFEGTVFDEAFLENVVFEECSLKDASFFQSKLNEVFFQNNEAPYVNFMEAAMHLEILGRRFMVFVQWHPEFKGDLIEPDTLDLDAELFWGNEELFKTFLMDCKEINFTVLEEKDVPDTVIL